MADASTRRWRPPTLKGPSEINRDALDLALKTAFDNTYGLELQAILGVAAGQGLASSSTKVTGSKNGIATGLDTVVNVVASIDNGVSALNEWVSARPSPNTKGAIDLFVWKPTAAGDTTPIASTTERTVRWIATGNRRESQ